MKKKIFVFSSAVLLLSSCNDFLDKMPDSRTELDTEEKVTALLVSAYPESHAIVMQEMASDNAMDNGMQYSVEDKSQEEAYRWQDISTISSDTPKGFWGACYGAVAAANHALEAIEKMGNPASLNAQRGEALMCRAWGHFLLSNVFCYAYNPETANTDMGLPYSTEPEKTVRPNYERGTMQKLYENIEKDIEEALPLINDELYDVPKYHFNKQAALAFAARFFLNYQKWDLASKYATDCLGTNPVSLLRDWNEMQSYGITNDMDPRCNLYIKASNKCNFLLQTTISMVGFIFSNYGYITKYSHDSYISTNETLQATNIWGESNSSTMRCPTLVFKGGTMDRALVAKLPRLFEETDPVSQTGYYHSVVVPFRSDILLLERAEAYIMQKKYTEAAKDLTTWMQNWTKSTLTLDPDTIQKFYNSFGYYTSTAPTPKKHLNPSFEIDEEGSVQECMLQCVLNFKRIETIHEGMRWFDVKRYGINITRRVMNQDSECDHVTDSLGTNDLRRAIQLPFDIIAAGLERNPR